MRYSLIFHIVAFLCGSRDLEQISVKFAGLKDYTLSSVSAHYFETDQSMPCVPHSSTDRIMNILVMMRRRFKMFVHMILFPTTGPSLEPE